MVTSDCHMFMEIKLYLSVKNIVLFRFRISSDFEIEGVDW